MDKFKFELLKKYFFSKFYDKAKFLSIKEKDAIEAALTLILNKYFSSALTQNTVIIPANILNGMKEFSNSQIVSIPLIKN